MEATKRRWHMGLAWLTHSYGLSYVRGGAAANLRANIGFWWHKMSAQNRESRKKLTINHTSGRKSFVRILEQKRAGNNSTNMIDFYKETRWSKKKNVFVTADTEETYKKMQGRMDGLEPEQRTDEALATVFREVLGHRPEYARGLGEMVIPESSRQRDQLKIQQCLAEIEREKQDAEQQRRDAEQYKSQLEEMRAEMRDLRNSRCRLIGCSRLSSRVCLDSLSHFNRLRVGLIPLIPKGVVCFDNYILGAFC